MQQLPCLLASCRVASAESATLVHCVTVCGETQDFRVYRHRGCPLSDARNSVRLARCAPGLGGGRASSDRVLPLVPALPSAVDLRLDLDSVDLPALALVPAALPVAAAERAAAARAMQSAPSWTSSSDRERYLDGWRTRARSRALFIRWGGPAGTTFPCVQISGNVWPRSAFFMGS